MHPTLRVVALTLAVVGLCAAFAAAVVGLFHLGMQCNDSCASPADAVSWRQVRGAWQWSGQAGLSAIALIGTAVVLAATGVRRYQLALAGLGISAGAAITWSAVFWPDDLGTVLGLTIGIAAPLASVLFSLYVSRSRLTEPRA
jgi:hypothetical protein